MGRNRIRRPAPGLGHVRPVMGIQVQRRQREGHRPPHLDDRFRSGVPACRRGGGPPFQHGRHSRRVLQPGHTPQLRAMGSGRGRRLHRRRFVDAAGLPRPLGQEPLQRHAFRHHHQMGRIGRRADEARAHHHPEMDRPLLQRQRGLGRIPPHRFPEAHPRGLQRFGRHRGLQRRPAADALSTGGVHQQLGQRNGCRQQHARRPRQHGHESMVGTLLTFNHRLK